MRIDTDDAKGGWRDVAVGLGVMVWLREVDELAIDAGVAYPSMEPSPSCGDVPGEFPLPEDATHRYLPSKAAPVGPGTEKVPVVG